MAQQAYWAKASSLARFHDHTQTHHTGWDSSERVIGLSHNPLRDNTQHSQQTDIHVSGEIRTHNSSKQAAADPRLRPRGHWDRLRNLTSWEVNVQIYRKIYYYDIYVWFWPYKGLQAKNIRRATRK